MPSDSHRKKLIEVSLPLDVINDASAYDKMPGIGPHPKGIHPWWARLPLPCARAILFASVVDDPSSDPAFSDKDEDAQNKERERLFAIIRDLLDKKMHEKPDAFHAAIKEINRCCGKEIPSILGPFAGGGSIPLEASRLGFASNGRDLNPVAALITRSLIEILPKFADVSPVNPDAVRNNLSKVKWTRGRGVADDISFYAHWIHDEAQKVLSEDYPKANANGQESTVIAWRWARTAKCPNPVCGEHGGRLILIRSFDLCKKKKGKRVWIEPILDLSTRSIDFEIREVGTPKPGTVKGRTVTCLLCKEHFPLDYVAKEGREGRIDQRLIALVADSAKGRLYLPPSKAHVDTIAQIPEIEWLDTSLPDKALGFRVQRYGMLKHQNLFTPRQLNSLSVLSQLIQTAKQKIEKDAASVMNSLDTTPLYKGGTGPTAYSEAITTFLAFALDRCVDFNNALCRWSPTNEKVMNLFGRQVVPMVWDFAEANLLANSVGGWLTCADYVVDCVKVALIGHESAGIVTQTDAALGDSNKTSRYLVSTDPPYYDNIGYSDLSDIFYIFLRKSVGSIFPNDFGTVLVPKGPELVAAPDRFDNDKEKAKEHFEAGFRKAFTQMKEKLDTRFPMTVYYAFKQSDETEDEQDGDESDSDEPSAPINLTTGWETMLEALVSSGFQITGTWPVRASQQWRMRAMGSNALASYVVLACRPRLESAPVISRRDFIKLLKTELPGSIRQLQQGHIAPVDLAQAAIGPGMAVYSRYSNISEADGSRLTVRSALQIINQILDELLAEQDNDYDRDTRWAVSWFEQFGFASGDFGVAEVLSKAKDTALRGLEDAGIVESKGGKVRLYNRQELDSNWDPLTDKRLTIWEITHYLIRALEEGGVMKAAALMKKTGSKAETAQELAYRLFVICEKKKNSQDAIPYNTLVVSWPEIKAAATKLPSQSKQLQMSDI